MILINYIFAFIGLLFASITDIKTREIPDWLNFSMIGLGLGTALIYSFLESSFSYLWSSLLGLAVAVLFAMLFYKTGQWGGGDAKSLMGLGALIGFDIGNGIPVFLVLLLNLFIVGAIYGTIWSGVLAIKNREKFKNKFKQIIYDEKVHRMRKIVLGVSALGLLFFFFTPLLYKPIVLGISAFIFFVFYYFVYSKAVEKSCMEVSTKVSALTEGDWVIEPVYVKKTKKDSPYLFFRNKFDQDFKDNTLMGIFKLFNWKKLAEKRRNKLWENYYNKIVEDILFLFRTENKSFTVSIFEKLRNSLACKYTQNDREQVHEVLVRKTMPSSTHPIFNSINQYLKANNYYYDKELICGPQDKEGLFMHQIKKLKSEKIKFVLVKNGLPFLPSFFIAFIITWIFGNWLLIAF